MTGRLWWQLLRVGVAAGRGAPGDRLRVWGLVLASGALAIVALAGVAVIGTYDGREARNALRGPIPAESAREAVALWDATRDAVGEFAHDVIFIEPLRPDAEPPPGLGRWPAPGEALLSPELARRGEPEGIKSRYGEFAGLIDETGLASPSERLAYVRPLHPPEGKEKEFWTPIRGFGQGGPVGEMLDVWPLSYFLIMPACLAGVPAAALLVVAARTGSQTRDRRGALLQALGGTWRHRALVNIGEAAPALAVGIALGTAPFLLLSFIDTRIPLTGHTIEAADLRAAWPMGAVALLLTFLAGLAMVVALHQVDRDGRSTRPRPHLSKVPGWRLYGCGVAVAAVVYSQYLDGTKGLIGFAGGTVALWALLPSVAAVACRALGARVASMGYRLRRPGPLIGGRWTAAHPDVIVRLSAAMIIGLGLVCQLQIWNSRVGESAKTARASQKEIADRVLLIRPQSTDPQTVSAFAKALPAGSYLFALGEDHERNAAVLTAPCQELKRLRLTCSATPEEAATDDSVVRNLRRWYGPHGLLVKEGTVELEDVRREALVVVSTTSGRRTEVLRAAHTELMQPSVTVLGQEWLIGAANKERLSNWFFLFGISGLTMLLLAAWIGAAAEFLRFQSALAPLAVLTGSRRIFGSVALWHLTIPLLLGTAVAASITTWHGLFFISVIKEGTFSWPILAAATAACAFFAALAGLLGTLSATKASHHWHPTTD